MSPPAPPKPPSPRRPPGHALVRQVVSEWLEARPAVFQQLLAKAQGAARAADAAKKARDLVRRKTSLTRSTLPGKLADCTSETRGYGLAVARCSQGRISVGVFWGSVELGFGAGIASREGVSVGRKVAVRGGRLWSRLASHAHGGCLRNRHRKVCGQAS